MLADRGQWRRQDRDKADVIEPYKGHIFGYALARFAQCLENTKHHEVGEGEDGSESGLHNEHPGPTRAYRRFLLHASQSPVWQRVERVLDYVWPKSLVLYGTRVATGRP